MNSIDIVSDLHVEYWEDYPYDWKNNKNSENVLIVGDVSDNIDLVIKELKKACDIYKNVLYVDGNHESTNLMYDLELANEMINKNMQYKYNFYNLNNVDFIIGDLVFIGACSWWDFNICNDVISIDQSIENFKKTVYNWADYMNPDDIVKNIINKSKKDYESLCNKITYLKDYYNICVVTHTVPCKEMLSNKYPLDPKDNCTYGNSMLKELMNEESIKYFIFGHNHDTNIKEMNNKLFINNARGRPQDFNRRIYKPYTLYF